MFQAVVRRVPPDARIDRLDISPSISDSFFSLPVPYPGRLGEPGVIREFYGIHEDNDSTKRLMVIINYHMDVGSP